MPRIIVTTEDPHIPDGVGSPLTRTSVQSTCPPAMRRRSSSSASPGP